MSDQEAAMNRLLKKLSGVRATLNRDERELLDEFVLRARFVAAADTAEVEPHALKGMADAVDEVTEVQPHAWKNLAGAVNDVVEVEPHVLHSSVVDASVSAIEEATQEVLQHSMSSEHALESTVDAAKDMAIRRVDLDTGEVYRLVLE